VTETATFRGPGVSATAWTVLIAISLCHMINDIMQSMLAAIYPLLREEFSLSYWQVGLMTFAFQVTASLLQPVVGLITDKRPMPRSLAVGMGSTFFGVLLLALAREYWVLLTGAMLIGIGSAVFHPESSRVARIASGGRFLAGISARRWGRFWPRSLSCRWGGPRSRSFRLRRCWARPSCGGSAPGPRGGAAPTRTSPPAPRRFRAAGWPGPSSCWRC
jgi:hypothetical protein